MAKSPSYARWSLEPYSIGLKLRALRTEKRLTLSRLAVETGLSTALLSKLETDRMIPTLPTLASICRVYGVGLSHFFAEAKTHTLSITRNAHLMGNGRGQESVRYTPLNVIASDAKLVVEMIEFPPAGAAVVLESGRQVSRFVYVLDGRLKLDAGGMQEMLESGDCVHVESEMAMAWSAAGKNRCRVLVVAPATTSGVDQAS
jgi:transcriptional regulator with XRE-family HTH domain